MNWLQKTISSWFKLGHNREEILCEAKWQTSAITMMADSMFFNGCLLSGKTHHKKSCYLK